MIRWQGGDSLMGMTRDAEFFRFFFPHAEKGFMVGIMGEKRRCFLRRVPEKEKHPPAKGQKDNIV